MSDGTQLNAGTGGDLIATDDITDGGVANGQKVERVKAGYGPDGGYKDVTAAAGLPVASQYLEVSGSAAANNTDLVSQDAAGYRWVSVQVTGTWVATITFQTSNDNTNWVSHFLSRTDANANPAATTTANNVFAGNLSARYFRVRTTAYTSGTASAVVGFSVHPGWPAASTIKISNNDNFATGDAAGLGAAFGVNAIPSSYNGTNFDRVRAINTAKNTTGLGIPASGALGFDGTNYQALKTDTSGNQTAIPANLEVTGSSSSNTSFITQDAAGYRWVSVQLTGPFSATVNFECSNDNATWVTMPLPQANSSSNNTPLTLALSPLVVSGPLVARYFRLRTSSYSSGTVNATVEFTSMPSGTAGTYISGVGGTVTVGGTIVPLPSPTAGWSVFSQTALSTTVQAVKASQGVLGGYMIYNPNSSVAYVQVFNVASGSVTLGTTAPTYVLAIPALSSANLELTMGVQHSTAISMAATTTATGLTAPTTALTAAIFYK